MSMNLYIQGKRSITVDKTNKKELQFTNVGVWQTPTNTTREIIKSDNPLERYYFWLTTLTHTTADDVYNHIEDIQKQITKDEKEGYEFSYLEI